MALRLSRDCFLLGFLLSLFSFLTFRFSSAFPLYSLWFPFLFAVRSLFHVYFSLSPYFFRIMLVFCSSILSMSCLSSHSVQSRCVKFDRLDDFRFGNEYVGLALV